MAIQILKFPICFVFKYLKNYLMLKNVANIAVVGWVKRFLGVVGLTFKHDCSHPFSFRYIASYIFFTKSLKIT